MKIKNGFIMRKVAGMTVVTAADSSCDFDGMITLNETAEQMWLQLEKGATQQELVDALLSEYQVDKQTAEDDVLTFISTLKENGILDENTY